MVASESMIFVFEFSSKPFAYSRRGNFVGRFHSLSCVDCSLCRLVCVFVFDHVLIVLLTLYDINYFTWSACEGQPKYPSCFPHFAFVPLTLQTSMDVTSWRLRTYVLFKGTRLLRIFRNFWFKLFRLSRTGINLHV